ncbi:hemagglutinin repeat-containing protein [Snodgrassella sp. ESL0324]|uniref:hemagglutinin repeat-containing protein n=1 Tax=Snodgrassella sp. ESL0324 TaxID=2705033 RepID=UPI001581DD73|nr:hemagglutinin repeat-containing protein [Snodgrassella sp. ESL0324]NUF09849.1 filamentous hemagglutinin N-terminal domain-containing protein [Snodgrassella sp. ESL0324]
MNKNLFKVIFNKKRGQMMAVAENTIREGKSTTDSTAGSTVTVNSTIRIAGLPVLAWSILLGFGLCTLVIDSGWAGSIHADTSAPKNQQPTILQTANGTPQINIQTPTKSGVSINQFRQMDVDKKGAILNNSRKNTETSLAGWIQANPWLGKGEARVIVNQINSTNPSQLNGYIEVAGRRAEVIIANPAGINVNGSGFINAAGVTLTTGKPLIGNGNLDGFEVRQGNISISGDGLNTGGSEYTRILSQAAQINAGIWANNLNITAGSNNIDAQGNITESVPVSAENKPLVAIDAGRLGGMYAGKIVLISTDKGVGVNNAGQIYAGNGNLSIDANGYLSNSGSIVVSDQKSSGADIASVSLNADRIMNSGTVSSQGKMLVHSEQLENTGLLTTADEINLRQQKLHNQGEINAGRIDIIADNIHNQNGKIIQTGTQSLTLDLNKLNNRNNGLISYEPRPDESALPEPNIPISLEPGNQPEPAKPVTPPTTATGGGQIVPADNTHKTQFETGQIISNQEIINDNGQIVASGGIDLTSKAGLNNHGSLNLNKLTVSGEIFDNYQGKLSARQALINTDSIDNHEGEIITAESLSAKSGKLDNRKGKLQSVKGIDIDSAQLDNSDNGLIAAQEQLSIQSGNINNSLDGKIQSGASLKLKTNNLNNRQGSIDSNSLVLKADIVDNSKGAIRTNQQLNAQIGSSLNNQGGEFGSGGDVLLNSEGESHLAVDNSDGGKIIAGKDAYLNTESIKNNNKGIISSENLNLKAVRAENTAGGVIQAGKQLKAQIDEKLDNTGGEFKSNEELLLNADGQSNLVLNNSANGQIQAGKHAVIHTATLDNSNNGSIDAGSIDLTADSIDNMAGNIRANKQLNAQINQKLLNQYGQISSADNVNIHDQLHNTLEIDNTNNGKILAGNDLNLQAKKLDYASTDDAGIAAGHDASIDLTDDFNINGNISANAGLKLHSNGKIINNHNVIGDSVIIDASRIDNQAAGTIQSNKHTELNVQDSVINRGLINSNGLTLIQAGNFVDNVGTGRIYGDHVAIGTGSLLNREEVTGNETKAATIAARQKLDIGARDIVNREQGSLLSEGDLAIGGKLDEQYHASGMADSLINSSARIEAKGNGNIAVNELRNLNNHFALEEYLANSEQHIQQYLFPGQTEKWTEGVDGHFNERGEGHKHSEFYFNDGRPTVTEKKTDISWWDFNRNTYKQRVSESSPGEIIIGGNLNISGSHWENNNSRILVGGNLTGADSLQLDNIESKGQQRVVDTGTTGGYKKSKKGGLLNRHDVYKRKVRGEINETTITTIDLENPVSIIQQHTKGDSKDNTIAGVNNNTSNIEKAGSAYTGDSSIDGLNSNGNRNQDTNTITSNNSGTDNVNVNYTGSNDYYLSANNQPVGDNQTEGAKVPSIKTLINLNTKLPNSSFYHIDPDNKGYLIEADPAFTNKNKWLSSNYMLEALGQDPEKLQKRLGDGYYEQRLINEQIDQLTGYRRLAGYESDEDEYKALMDAGVSMAKAIGLVPGIALSADQMARLTSDIVWMVSQTVTMPDGSQQSVLVPQVYLMVRDGDLNTAGALISADNISLHTNKDINNQGTVAGRKVVDLGAHNLSNSGLISGKTVLANAANNIDINGGTVQAQDMLSLQAQRINVNTTTATHGDERNGGTVIDRVAGLYVTGGKNGILAVNSVEDLNFHGANIVNTATNGLTQLASSNGSVNLGTVQTASHSGYGELSARNHLALDHKDEIGTQVIADGNVSLTGNKVNIRQSDINSTNGNINIYGKEGVNITEGRAKTDLDEAHYNKTRGTFSTKKSIDKYQKHNDEAKGSTITGSNISIGSEQDINIRGSNVIADNQTVLRAGNNITVEAAENQYEGQEYHARKKSGLMGSGGFGFFIGSQKQTDDTTNKSLIHSGSSVGSLKGDTTVIAGNHYTQSGSTVSSTEGNVTVVAKQINVQAAQDQYSTDYVHTMKQSGITVGVNSPVVSSVQKAGAAVERINKSKNDRVNAMAAFNAGMDTYKAGSAVADIANNPQNAMNASVGITVGQQKVRMESHTKDTVASASRINAGGTVNLLATGAGKDSNINIIGSDVAGSKGTHFQADNEINLLAAEQNHSESSSNKSSGWSAGMNIGYGTGSSALGLTAGANRGKGHSNGDETSYRNSHVGSSSGSTSLSSGGATNIKGAQVRGKGVSMDAAELNAASLQDKARYDSKQENTSGQVTVGYGASGSASYSKSKIKADYAGVTEQSGIIAGDDGYQINVKGNTDLKGAIITSASAAEAAGKNSLVTGSLTSSDIKNHSDYKGKSAGLTLSGSSFNQDNSTVSKSLGFGSDSGKDSSKTKSGVNTSRITITDKLAQQQKTGKTAEETIAAIHTNVSSEDYADKAGYLHNNFDKNKVQKELDSQREVSQEFDQNRQELKKELLSQARKKYEEAEAERRQHGGLRTEKSIELEKEGRKIEQNVAYLDTGLGIVWANGIGTAVLETAAQHADYAKNAAKHKTAGQVYKVTCSGAAAQYQCQDINNVKDALATNDASKITNGKGDAPFEGTAIQIYDYNEIMNGKTIAVSNPGIYNGEDSAFRNAVKQNPEAAANGNLYVIVNNPSVEAIPGLSEVVFYALYDKINENMGGRLPLTNAEKTNNILKLLAKETDTVINSSNHSRGSMTEKVSTAYLQNVLGETNIPTEKNKFLGPAANIVDYYKMLSKNGYKDKNGINSTLFLADNNTDFVGRLVGANPATGGTCAGNPLGSCYSHGSYNGNYYLDQYLTNSNGQKSIDKNTGKPIRNPEFEKIEQTVAQPKQDQNGRYINPTLAKAVVVDRNGNINFIDRQGNVTTIDQATNNPIKNTQIPIHEINGTRYFEFEGKKYYADPNR